MCAIFVRHVCLHDALYVDVGVCRGMEMGYQTTHSGGQHETGTSLLYRLHIHRLFRLWNELLDTFPVGNARSLH